MRVLVSGATGYIGSSLMRALKRSGLEPVGLARSRDKADALRIEGADWVMVSDEAPIDEQNRDELLQEFQTHYHGGTAGSISGTALEQGDGTDDEEENGETQDPGRED